jgi:beta-phosphoglucomutase-like phosphatase (HAD superfamily)
MIDAVIFDLDGLLLDSEGAWDAARRELVEETGVAWRDGATKAMLGMSAPEWSAYVRDELGFPREPAESPTTSCGGCWSPTTSGCRCCRGRARPSRG